MTAPHEADTYPAEIHGRWTIRMPHARAIQYLRDPQWEHQRIAHMAQHIAPHHVVYDIGAEQGDMSALFASWVPEGGVVLVEPNASSWPSIRTTFEANGLRLPFAAWEGFCGAESTITDPLDHEAFIADGWPGCAYGPVDTAAGFAHLAQQADGIPTTTLDDLMAAVGAPPDVVTMDVEGSELEVLRGAGEVLSAHRPLFFVSVHPRFLADLYGARFGDVLDLFESYRYRCHVLSADHEVHVMAEPRR